MFLMLFAILFFPSMTLASDLRYLDIEDDQIVSVFNNPGHNWKTCATNKNCQAVAWPDNRAALKALGPAKKMKVLNPYTDKLQDEEFVQVEYSYQRVANGKTYHQKGRGWVDAAYLSETKRDSFYTEAATSQDDPECICKPGQPCQTLNHQLGGLSRSLSNSGIVDIADQLDDIVGDCALSNRNSPRFAAGNPYDAHIMPGLRKKQIPRIQREDGQMMTKQDLINIDSLARTMYGEMASCYKHGLQYPMTVARIAVNRADDTTQHSNFIRGDHAPDKAALSRVVTSPSQFSVWQKKDANNQVNGPLLMAMCPPQKKGGKFWKSDAAPRDEHDIWKNTVRIATEAILFPNRFKNRTIKVYQYYYTSGLGKFYNFSQSFPSIEGRKVARNSCVEVWE